MKGSVGKRGKASKRDQVKKLGDQQPFTVASLSEIFRIELASTRKTIGTCVVQAKLRKSLNRPLDADLLRIVEHLNGWQQRYHFWLLQNPECSLTLKKEQESVDQLLSVLPIIQSRLAMHIKIEGSHFDVRKKEIDALIMCLKQSKRSRFAVNILEMPPLLTSMSWKDILEPLTQMLINVLKKTNPTRSLGVSERGPISRMVCALLPRITGEILEPSTVARQMKVMRTHSRET